MAGPGNILIKIGAETADAVRGLNNVEKAMGDTMTRGQKATAGLKKAALPAAAAMAAVGYAAIDATKAAMEDEAASEKLAGQLKRVTGATKDQVKAAEAYITKLSLQTGIADDDLRPALGKLATATGDVEKAQKALALATDISAQTGKDLDAVSSALAKGYGGNTAALGRLIPGLDKATLATKDMTKITDELARLTKGAASEAAQTAAGRYQVFQVQMQELKESIGAGLIPVVQALMPLLQSAARFASENTTAIQALAAVVAVLAGGILAANAAIKLYEAGTVAVKVATAAWTAVQWLLNAALDANPIGLVVIALASLGAALVVAYKKSETFRDIVHEALGAVKVAANALDSAFDALRGSAAAAFDWIVEHWKLALFAFGPIGAAIYLLSENFDKVKAAGRLAADIVDAAWNVGRFGFQQIANLVAHIANAFDGVVSAVRVAVEWVTRLIDLFGKIHVPKIKKPGWLPFAAPPVLYPVPSARTAGAVATNGAGGITVNVYGAIDPEGTARTIRRVLQASDRRQGRTV